MVITKRLSALSLVRIWLIGEFQNQFKVENETFRLMNVLLTTLLKMYVPPTRHALFLNEETCCYSFQNFVMNIRRAEGLYNAAKQASDDTWRVEPDSNSDGYSGSVEMGCSPISNVSRGLSVESEIRPLSHSSDEVLPQTTDTLRVVVPQLGQSLPDLKEATRRWLAPPPRPLAPPPAPPRGSSYPPPSPPLRRSPAIRHNTMDKPEQ
uniref:Uncharacterized protein n=1 Tax=Lygus hesperus TaxID=30085 RepID=A0A0A9Y890_LYGHE